MFEQSSACPSVNWVAEMEINEKFRLVRSETLVNYKRKKTFSRKQSQTLRDNDISDTRHMVTSTVNLVVAGEEEDNPGLPLLNGRYAN